MSQNIVFKICDLVNNVPYILSTKSSKVNEWIYFLPACEGSWPDPPPDKRVTFPAAFTAAMSSLITTE